MKLTIEVPDGTGAVSVTYVYDEGDLHKIGTKLLDTKEIEMQRGSEEA